MSVSDLALDELRRRALATPEEPFVFFRGERAHFRWWSFSRCLRELEAGPVEAEPAEPAGATVPRELLAALAASGAAEVELARALLHSLGPGAQRDVVISWRSLESAPERVVALAALAGGWALLREPADRLPPSTFSWARPTVLAGEPGDLAALLDGFEAIAPRAFRARWLRRRLARLRAVVLLTGGAREPLAARVAALGGAARVLPFPDAGW